MPSLPSTAELYRRAEALGRLWGIPDFAGRVDIAYSGAMRSRVGYADLQRLRVRLNSRLLERYPAELDDTLVHELAHAAAVILHGLLRRPHGREWKRLMLVAGKKPTTTHDLDVRGLFRSRPRWLYLHHCPRCGAHRVCRRVVRRWICAACRPGTLDVWKFPDSSAGRMGIRKKVGVRG
jgi:predicted SprT family Zn-dependent metalloprotease